MSKSGFARLAGAAVLSLLLGACGGSGGSPSSTLPPTTPPGGSDPPSTPDPVTGVAMPSSVSVVTATNAS